MVIDTYLPYPPDRYPAYLERRVYQGSSGRVYPLPFHERISPSKVPHTWNTIHIENKWLRVILAPELGGRILVGLDKTNGYDFFYRNNVIKPALVGLAGPWLSGGVEFNWPQHHRPATFLPMDSSIEYEDDGAVTVWCSDHDPFTRMKGMHGVRLRPESKVIELRVRLFNRTDDVQTFLWWANAAVPVNDDYQSFFPSDVHFVADHAKRATTGFPRADRPYYGVDYPSRVDAKHPDADRLDWYRNIPVPTSYMCVGSAGDFFGGYDHGRQAGFVHWADHLVAPGKKQWTWGNGSFGRAWDRNLTDSDGPYVELMAGVYTDNQPDFSFLAPGETKTFSQFWYPIRKIGPAHLATLDAAVRLDVAPTGKGRTSVTCGVDVTAPRPGTRIKLADPTGAVLWETTHDIEPGSPVVESFTLTTDLKPSDLTLVVRQGGRELATWTAPPEAEGVAVPPPATEPAPPREVATVEELDLIGLHLEQYHHATRSPEPYWLEALRRDPSDARANVALAARRMRNAQYVEAEQYLHAAITRLIRLNPNPYDGEAYYRLGQVLMHLGRLEEAHGAFAKAGWNDAWYVPSQVAQARLDARVGCDDAALAHARHALARDSQQLQARDIVAVLLRRAGRSEEAEQVLAKTLALDPLDEWARALAHKAVTEDPPTRLDVALEFVSVGEVDSALDLLLSAAELPTRPGQVAIAPLAHYHRADLFRQMGRTGEAAAAMHQAQTTDATWCLASRLEDIDMLARASAANPQDSRAQALLGHWLYAHERKTDAIAAWTKSVGLDDRDPVVWRNLAVSAFNVSGDPQLSAVYYGRARRLAPDDARLLYESDQLAARSGASVKDRLAVLEARQDLLSQRDDLTITYVSLLAVVGQAHRALRILRTRQFQPWEGGEGQVLGAWDQVHLVLARDALGRGDASTAVALAEEALDPPANLGEGRHILANCANLWLMLGDARTAAGDQTGAQTAWRQAATAHGDFQEMATTRYSEMTYYAVLALRRLGDETAADALAHALGNYAGELRRSHATIDYFATSLPTMLLFEDDLDARQAVRATLIEAQLAALQADPEPARERLNEVLSHEPANAHALELRSELG